MTPFDASSGEVRATRWGVFDLDHGPQLGGLLIQINELLALECEPRSQELELLAFGSQLGRLLTFESGKLISNEDTQPGAIARVLSAVSEIAGVRRVRAFPSLDALTELMTVADPSPEFHPSLERVRLRNVEYGSTLLLQAVFARSGRLPHLSMRRERLASAHAWLERHVFPAVPVVVHLKNTGVGPLNSDADFSEWWPFFTRAAQTHPDVRFVLIGNDPVPAEYSLHDNMLRPTGLDKGLAQDLAVIQLGHSFLGMSSGPCQMALLSDVPYVIYKNPHQHVEHIEREIGLRDRFPFATESQYFLRVIESRDNLHSNFSRLWNEHGRERWKRRITGLLEKA